VTGIGDRGTSGRFDLDRFVTAQEGVYAGVLDELRRGRKTGHWIWFIFPQIAGLGRSDVSRFYSIASLDEARAYLAHPVLGVRLIECTTIVAGLQETTATEVFGDLDAMKVRSSMTLFHRVAPDEPAFVRRWVEAVRAHGGSLAGAGLLVRPHPLAATGFRDLRIDDPQVAIWPGHGEFPLAGEARQNYFDSIFHSTAVVGINTSAQIEAAIVGRPVFTILDPEYADTQAGTLHFRYLADGEFGHLHAAATLEEHAAQLQRAVDGEVPGDLNERFLRRFVRPFGLDVRATERAVDAIEALGSRGPLQPERGPAAGPVVRLALEPLARRAAAERRRQKQARSGLEPAAELKAAARRLAEAGPETAIAAERWAGSETQELLYWIPFLRWALLAMPELRGRLAVGAGPEAVHWYGDLDARIVALEDGEDVRTVLGTPEVVVLDPDVVERHSPTLSATDPFARLHDRRLQFAPLPAPGTAERFVAVDGTFPAPAAEHRSLAGLDGVTRGEVIARSAGFLGSFGADACVAVLAGRPAVVPEPASEDAADFGLLARLAQGPYGSVRAVSPDDPDPLALLAGDPLPVGAT